MRYIFIKCTSSNPHDRTVRLARLPNTPVHCPPQPCGYAHSEHFSRLPAAPPLRAAARTDRPAAHRAPLQPARHVHPTLVARLPVAPPALRQPAAAPVAEPAARQERWAGRRDERLLCGRAQPQGQRPGAARPQAVHEDCAQATPSAAHASAVRHLLASAAAAAACRASGRRRPAEHRPDAGNWLYVEILQHDFEAFIARNMFVLMIDDDADIQIDTLLP